MLRSKGDISIDEGFPFKGLDSRTPSTGLASGFSPSLSNVIFEKDTVGSRYGYGVHAPTWDSLRVMKIFEHTDQSGVKYLFCATLDNIWKWDSENTEWVCVTEIISEDGNQSNELPLQDCEDYTDWTKNVSQTSWITLTDSSEIKKVGSNALAINLHSGFSTGEFCFDDFTNGPVNLSAGNALGFWVRSSVNYNAGDLKIVLYDKDGGEDAGGGAGNATDFLLPALVADIWKYCVVAGTMQNDYECISLQVVGDRGTCDMYFDDICALSVLTGDEDDAFEVLDFFDGTSKKLLLTNGKDLPLVWDSSQKGFLTISTDLTDFIWAKHMVSFYGRVVVGNYSENSAERPQSIGWSVFGDHTDWTTTPGAGASVLADLDGEIYKLLPLGDQLIVYSRYSIGMLSYIGGDYTFSFDVRVRSLRLASPSSIINLGPFHLFLGEDNFYLYDGGVVATPIGDQVSKELIDELNPKYLLRCFAFNDTTRNRAYFFIPTTSSEIDQVYVLHYNLRDMSQSKWTKMAFAHQITSVGQWSKMKVETWESLKTKGITWEGWSITWDSTTSSVGFPSLIFGATNGKTFEQSDSSTKDDTSTITSRWESKDITIPQEYRSRFGRWLELEIELKGDSVSVQYSTDGGGSWVSITTQSLTNKWESYILYLDTYSERIRFRFYNSTSGERFELRWMRVWGKMGASR